MRTVICDTKPALGRQAAAEGAQAIRQALAERGEATIIVATGASQFEVLDALVAETGIDWSKVRGFHLDEYKSLPMDHPASFRGYLKRRFVDRVPLKAFRYINGEGDLAVECARLAEEIRKHPIDAAFIGIGENGHLAFNDPPADFKTVDPYIVVTLDRACRMQQVGEGWFEDLEHVPTHAISMSIRQIMSAGRIICSVPDRRKAQAVRSALEGPVTPDVPASILQQHKHATIYLDRESASLLRRT